MAAVEVALGLWRSDQLAVPAHPVPLPPPERGRVGEGHATSEGVTMLACDLRQLQSLAQRGVDVRLPASALPAETCHHIGIEVEASPVP